MKSLKTVYCDNITGQCIEILNKWINEYLERHNLGLLEINYEKKYVVCYKKNCNNIFEDYFTFNYIKIDLFK